MARLLFDSWKLPLLHGLPPLFPVLVVSGFLASARQPWPPRRPADRGLRYHRHWRSRRIRLRRCLRKVGGPLASRLRRRQRKSDHLSRRRHSISRSFAPSPRRGAQRRNLAALWLGLLGHGSTFDSHATLNSIFQATIFHAIRTRHVAQALSSSRRRHLQFLRERRFPGSRFPRRAG